MSTMARASREFNKNVLVVDDDPSIHRVFTRILVGRPKRGHALAELDAEPFGARAAVHAPGFVLSSAYQNRDALDKVCSALASGQPYALAFVDLGMPPGWIGVDTIEQLWKHDPDLQLVACSGRLDFSWSGIVSRLGPSDRLLLLRKPFTMPEVLQLARVLSAKWSVEQHARVLVRMSHQTS